MKTHPRREEVEKIEQETYGLLEDTGLPYKKVSRYHWVDEDGTACWCGESEEAGFIKIYRGCEPGAVAHEIGHGFHEALNQHKGGLMFPFRYPEDGEAVAEAIRFFVEQRRGSSWRPTRDTQTLNRCGYDFQNFVALVKT
jgi:hypothetical protein